MTDSRKGRWARYRDVDWVLVDRDAARERTPPLGVAERVNAVRLLTREGLRDWQIAARLWWWRSSGNGLTGVSVFRYRHGIPPGVPCTRTRGTRAA